MVGNRREGERRRGRGESRFDTVSFSSAILVSMAACGSQWASSLFCGIIGCLYSGEPAGPVSCECRCPAVTWLSAAFRARTPG